MKRRGLLIAAAVGFGAGTAAAQDAVPRTPWGHPDFQGTWTVEVPLHPSDGQIFEVACHEGNLGLANILSGHRAEERAAAGR